jgi:glutamate carboxypeptidase
MIAFDKPLHALCEQAKPDLLANLERLVNIDSGSGHTAGLIQMADLLVAQLQDLGLATERVPDRPGESCNVVGRLRGQGRTSILMFAHMDTVFPPGTAAERPFRMDGGRGFGPGVSDDKGSIVLGLAALKLLTGLGFEGFKQLTVCFNCDEETGSAGSKGLLRQLAQQHDVALCLEPGRENDGVVDSRKGSAILELTVKGRAAHAGAAPEQGRNALMEIIHQIGQLSHLDDPATQTTVHFSVLKAGERSNVIPDRAFAQADVRTTLPEELARIRAAALAASSHRAIADTEVRAELTVTSPPFPANPRTGKLVAMAQAIYGELGLALSAQGSGGASDANETAAAGAATLDGLGLVGGGANHTPFEFAQLDSVVPRLYLLTRLIQELASEEAPW